MEFLTCYFWELVSQGCCLVPAAASLGCGVTLWVACPCHQGHVVVGFLSIPSPLVLAKVLSKEHAGQLRYTDLLGRASGDFCAHRTTRSHGENNPEGSTGKWDKCLWANSRGRYKTGQGQGGRGKISPHPLQPFLRDLDGVINNINALLGEGGEKHLIRIWLYVSLFKKGSFMMLK